LFTGEPRSTGILPVIDVARASRPEGIYLQSMGKMPMLRNMAVLPPALINQMINNLKLISR
jgi:hypothetical protein